MVHIPDLIQDLGVILITAAVTTLIFKKLKQPMVLGYLVAGFLVGPHITFLPSVTDGKAVHVWAEIGVIFLLFGLGLEFSFKKLSQVGKGALNTAIFQMAFMLGLGFFSGQILGWTKMDSLFLGGILSISSTTIIARAFEEYNLKGRSFVSFVFGILILEDIFAVLLMVLLSTVAVTQSLAGSELLLSTMRLGFYLILWFLVGIYLIPMFLNKVRSLMNDEITLIVATGLCFLMVILATKAGFSAALGAFVMGSILSETRDVKKIEHLMVPLRDLFGAVFFVSVGMLIEPQILVEKWKEVIFISIVVILGKGLSVAFGALLSGEKLKRSVQAGMSLAQIGEFSFIIATLGLTLKVTSDFLYPIAVAVSVITTFTTPYMIKMTDPFYHWLEIHLPKTLLDRLTHYQAATAKKTKTTFIGLVWQIYGFKMLFNSVIVVAFTFASKLFLLPLLLSKWDHFFWCSLVAGGVALLMSAPFLWALAFGSYKRTIDIQADQLVQLKSLQFGLTVLRGLWLLILIGFVVAQFTPAEVGSSVMFLSFAILVVFFSRFAEPVYKAIENRFISNLTESERIQLQEQAKKPQLTPWDATLSEFVVSPQSELVAKTLMESQLKEKFGVTVALIERGLQKILAPQRTDLILPYDKLFLIGNEEQLSGAQKVIEATQLEIQLDVFDSESYGLESMAINTGSTYIGQSIRECGLREKINGLIVGIERNNQRILSPDSSMVLQDNDVVWIVGDRFKIREIQKI